MSNPDDVRDRVRTAMAERGLSQKDAAAQVGAAEAGGIGFEEGPQGSANGQTSGMRVGAAGSRVAGPAVPGGTSDRSSPPGADDSGPGKPGGAALKKHKVEIPSIGGGKGIRNAPSRTY